MKKIIKEGVGISIVVILIVSFLSIAEWLLTPKPKQFLVAYDYWSEVSHGKGNMYITMTNRKWDRPDRYRTNELIVDELNERYPTQDFAVVILNIIPLPVK